MDAFVARVLELRERPGPRAELRRARSEATAHYAVPFLAPWWQDRPWMRDQALAFAALAAENPRVDQADSVRPGHLLAQLTAAGAMHAPGVERRLLALQTVNLPRALPFVRRTLTAAGKTRLGVDWTALWQLCRSWDHPDLETRRRVRMRVLEDYYQTPPPTTGTHPDNGSLT